MFSSLPMGNPSILRNSGSLSFSASKAKKYTRRAVRFAQEVNLDLPIISCNGSVIKSCDGKTIFEHHIDDKIAREAIEFCLENNWHIQWYIDDELYVNEIKPDLWTGYENVFKIDVKEAKGQLDKYSRRIVQMVILDKAGHIQSIAPKVRDRFTASAN